MAGSVTSSIKYNNLKDGNAIKIKKIAGEIVQTNSISVNPPGLLDFRLDLDYIFWDAKLPPVPRVVSEDPFTLKKKDRFPADCSLLHPTFLCAGPVTTAQAD